jgi:hypothetical protein
MISELQPKLRHLEGRWPLLVVTRKLRVTRASRRVRRYRFVGEKIQREISNLWTLRHTSDKIRD